MMAMSDSGRTDALFAAMLSNNPRANNMSADEKTGLKQSLSAIFGQADLSYWQANADIVPASLTAPATGVTVATSTGPASGSTVPATVTGLGKIL